MNQHQQEPTACTIAQAMSGPRFGDCPAPSVGSWLRARAEAEPKARAFRYLKQGGEESADFSFLDLDLQARRLAAWLLKQGRPGDRVLLAHAPGPDFAAAFFACQYAGFVAVPAFPPKRSRHGDRVAAILADAQCRLALADAVGRASLQRARESGDPAWATVSWPKDGEAAEGSEALAPDALHRPAPGDLAFLQYTSGSTGTPKGVMVSHANLAHNIGLQRRAIDFRPGDRMVSWAPFFHDLGLIHGLLLPIALGGDGVYFPANEFLQNPGLWLRTLSDEGGTHSCAPNFAYDLCTRAIDAGLRPGYDLRRWRFCTNAAEPVRVRTVRDFEDAFAVAGLRRGVVQPCYGLAEATLYVSAGIPGEPVQEHPRAAAAGGLAVCGEALGQTVLAVDPSTGLVRAEGAEGELWVQGPSVALGYWNRIAESAETFGARAAGRDGRFLRTGDLGIVQGGRVVITGRLKDLVILRGVNHYPQDLEETAAGTSGELATGAAFAVDGPGGEGLVLVQETVRHPRTPLADLAAGLVRALARDHGVRPLELVLVPLNSVPRTSSGKVMRRATRAAYLGGGLKAVLRWNGGEAGAAPGADPLRADWLRSAALSLGALEPREGLDAPLAAWCLDSLRSAELCARYQARFGADLGALRQPERSLRELLALPPAAEARRPEPRPLDAPPEAGFLAPAARRRWRCHGAMESMWAAQMAAPASTAYHIAWTVRLEGRPDPVRLQAALERMAQSQVSLRCRFEADAESRLWQVDAGTLPALERPTDAPGGLEASLDWARLWSSRPFDPATAPLWRAAWLRLDGGSVLLAFCFHHLIFDQHSWQVFHEGLNALYLNPGAPDEPQSAAPPQCLELAAAREASLAFWRERLAGLRPERWAGALPLGDIQAPRTLAASLPARTVLALRAVAAQARCTPFTVAALAWAEALSQIQGGGDACFATPVTLRDQPLSGSQIGYWVQPMPLRLSCGADAPLRDRLSAASRTLREAMAHRGLSLAETMRAAGLPAPSSFLVYQGEGPLTQDWLGLRASIRELPPAGCKAPLALVVSGEETWNLSLEHHPEAVPEGTARRCLRAFLAACERIAGERSVPERSLLRGERLVPIEHRTVVEAFHARVLDDAQATALVWDGGTLSYGTLASQARALAQALDRCGVAAGDRVGVCAQAGPGWVAAMLGIFEAGAVYVPLDPAYPAERLKAMAEDARCRVVLSDQERPAWAAPLDWRDLGQALLARPPFLRTPGTPRPEDPAYIIFTSGSSGRPKGVQVSHGALMNNARGTGLRLAVRPSDRALQFVSICFDPSIQDVFPTLVAGASIALPCRRGAPGPAELAGWLRRFGVTMFILPTAYWHAFMQAGGAEHLAQVESLRLLLVGGEAPSPRMVREWNRVLAGKAALYNAYGPTESCVMVTLFECRPGLDQDDPVPLGLPMPGVELAVVGPDGALAPAGENGELWIGGDSLADGYIGPERLDRERFRPAAPDGAALRAFYRTGDLVNLDGQGRLVYRGRLDRQIKAAGVRMDLEEIEELLRRATGVSAAAVEAVGTGESLALRAWVAADPALHPEPAALAGWLAARLPQGCVPAEIRVLRALPLGPGGKVDRKALLAGWDASVSGAGPASHPASGTAGTVAEAPRLRLEALLCASFSEVLGRPVQATDDFFAMGGTSLRAVRLAGEASRRLERNVLVDQIYRASSPRTLAELLEPGSAAGGSGTGAGVGAREGVGVGAGEGVGVGVVAGADRGALRLLADGPGPDWVLLPPVAGRVDCYRGLAGQLAGRCRLWGLDLEQLTPPGDAWGPWIESCADAIEAQLPSGPLALGGWSIGGLIATDLAHVLAGRGRRVLRLTLIDTVLPDPVQGALALDDTLVFEELVERDLAGPAALGDGEGGGPDQARERYRGRVRALAGFTPRPVLAPLSLVVSERTAREEHRNGFMAWALLARAGMTTQLVPGDHFSLLSGGGLRRLALRLAEDVLSSGAPPAPGPGDAGTAPQLSLAGRP